MKKSIYSFGVLLLFSIFINAQYTIKGVVSDDAGKMVAFASVTLYNADNNKTVVFKNTDSQGQYSLSFSSPGNYIIKVRNIKYETHEENISITENKKVYPLDITLFFKGDTKLDEVVVKGRESLAKISGDTITFKIDRFTDKTEQNLGDIINKLPGMEVDENGDVKANGEKVDKILVDGNDFFSESQKMATQNLNAKAVKDIQLLTDYKEDGKLDDLNAKKQTALNVQLKEEYKNKVTGDALVGSGYESKYDFHTNLFKFNKKGNISFIGDFQNTGESVFTFQDYMGFLGGFSELNMGGRGRGFNVSFGRNSVFSLINASNNVEKRSNQVAALNINQKLNKNWKIKFVSINSGLQQRAYTEQFRDYYLGQKEQVYNSEKTRNFFTSNRFNVKFSPNDSVLLAYNAQFNYATNFDKNKIDNILDNNPQNFVNDNAADPWGIAQKLSYEFKPSSKTLMEFGASYDYQYDPNQNHVNSSQGYLGLPENQQNSYDTQYQLNKTTRNALLYSSFKYSKKKLIYKIELGGKWIDNHLKSAWQDYNTDAYIDATNYLYNFKFQKNEFYTDLNIAKNKDFWQYDLGVVLKNYAINNRVQNNFTRFAAYPYFGISANFSTTHVLSFDYEYKENFPEIENYLPAGNYLIQSYRNVLIANELIYNSTYFPNHQLALRYNYFNRFSGLSIWLNSNYNKVDGSITSYSQFVDDYNKIYNISGPESENGVVFMNFGKKFKLGIPMKIHLSGNYNNSKGYNGYNALNEKFYRSKSDGWGTNISFETDMKPKFNVEIGFKYNESNRKIDNPQVPAQYFSSNSPFIELRGAYEKSGITWKTTFEHSRNQNIRLNIWDIDFTYHNPLSKWEYGIVGRNLLNFNNKEQISVSQNSLYLLESRYKILPGYFMLTAKLKF